MFENYKVDLRFSEDYTTNFKLEAIPFASEDKSKLSSKDFRFLARARTIWVLMPVYN